MEALKRLRNAPLEEKAERIQDFYEKVVFHESGIMYSLMKIDGEQVRPFTPEDFVGKDVRTFDDWRIKPAGNWELFNNENSITTSGIYLASQSYRYLATGSEEALHQAGKAFRSLDLIYQLGEQDGRPGWMGKPYGFRLSDQTSGDQYLDATWGLHVYYGIAPDPHRRRIEDMIVGFADYWRKIDYQIKYFTSHWDCKSDRHAYNAVFLLINLLAYRFSGNPIHLREAEYFQNHALWHVETNVDQRRNMALRGEPDRSPFRRLVEGYLGPEEYLCWESTIHCKFVAVAVEIVSILDERFVDKNKLEQTLARWWSTWSFGIDEELLPYYYFIVNAHTDAWRPAPRTERLPVEERPLANPLFSYCSQMRWMEPLCRFLETSIIAALHAPGIAAEARDLAYRIMDSVDERRILWMYDPDGQQIIPELDYMNDALSSEMPATYLAVYWRGRLEKLW